MGVIREELVLNDSFSSTFSGFMSQGDEAVGILKQIASELDTVSSIAQNTQDFMAGFAEGFASEFERASQSIRQAGTEQERVTNETQNTAAAAGNWVGKIKSAIAALGAAKMAQNFVETADELTLINARLDAVNDGTYKSGQLQEQVYSAAQRSRASYQDTANLVSRIGQNASKTFNNAEAIQFAENMNKSFKLAGASQQEISSATLQLSQALAAGTLRGEEFNAINEAAPAVIQRIADYLGKEKSEIRDLAQQGVLSADVVKNAMLKATDEINKQFEAVPKTWADMMTEGQNAITMGLSDIMEQWTEFLNSAEGQELFEDAIAAVLTFAQIASDAFMAIVEAVSWVHDNWEDLLPIINLVGAAMLTYAGIQLATAVMSAAAWLMANWWILLVVAALWIAITALQAMGTKWADVGRVAGQVLGFIYATAMNVFVTLWNDVIAPFAEMFANVFNNPVNAIVQLFWSMYDTILGIVQACAQAIDALLNSNISGAIAGFRAEAGRAVDQAYATAVKVDRMETVDYSVMDDFGAVGESLGNKLDHMDLSLQGLADGIGGIDASNLNISDALGNNGGGGQVGKVGSVGKIESDVKLSDEDLKIYRDLAEARYMNRIELKTLAPNVKVTVPKSSNLNATDVANEIKAMLIEQAASHTATAHG